MYKKILVGVDGSKSSFHALKEALSFSKKYSAEVLALSIIPPHRELVSSFSIFGHIKGLIKDSYQKTVETVKNLAEEVGVPIKTILEEGNPYEKIIEVAQKENCELIVIGRRGITSFEKILIGSTAKKIINHSPLDVLIIPKHAQINFKKLLAGTDTSEYGNRAVKKAGEIAKKFNGELGVISVIKIPIEPIIDLQEVLNVLRKDLESHLVFLTEDIAKDGVKVELFIEFGEPYKLVIDTAKKIGADTIVISAYSSESEKSLGSVGEKIIADSFCSVLVVKS